MTFCLCLPLSLSLHFFVCVVVLVHVRVCGVMLRWATKRLYDTEPVFTFIKHEQKCSSIFDEQNGTEVGYVGVISDECIYNKLLELYVNVSKTSV